MSELLFEIGTEEIPAGYIAPALRSMEDWMRKRLEELGLTFASIRTAGTPRRLALTVAGLPLQQQDREKQHVGPAVKAAYDAAGQPTRAAEGFARSRGLTVAELQRKQTEKGEYLMAVEQIQGQQTGELLPDLLGELVSAIPFPKSMRWGNGSLAFARPIQWLLALFDAVPLTVQVENLQSGTVTRGHRFLANSAFSVRSWSEYQEKLLEYHVVADIAQRRGQVVKAVEQAVRQSSAGADARPELDEGLLDIVTNLVEEPFGVCGRFDEKFLELPPEVLITSMREHQKYFPVKNASGTLLPYFVAVNNNRVDDLALAADGHERVLRARLEDAYFFFREDRKHRLQDLQAGLAGIIFQNKLGTMLEKSERVAVLADYLAGVLAPQQRGDVRRAALLAKCDLLASMVGEFPTLQGIMGREYALADGENPEVARAIAEHYMPIRAGSALPEEMLGSLVGLADRMDTLIGCFGIGEKPTGTTDPFGLRRQALGLLRILDGRRLSLSLREFAGQAVAGYAGKVPLADDTTESVLDFIRLRLANDLVAAGHHADAVEAALAASFDDVPDCRERIAALEEISGREQFAVLAGSFKRIRNIVKEHEAAAPDPAHFAEAEEKELAAVFTRVAQTVEPLLAGRNYRAALEGMLQIKEPLDLFFDKVMVMAEEPVLRINRLNLLAAIGGLVLRVGDISRMSG